MSLTMIMAQPTTFNEDIKAYYYAPLKEHDFIQNIKDSNYAATVDELKSNMLKRMSSNYEMNNPIKDNTQYTESVGIGFYGKDGESDAYVKRGLDSEVAEYFQRQEISQRSWRFQTSDSYINFVSGGKIKIGEQEWIIAKVIEVYAGSDSENKIKGTWNMDLIRKFTTKTLILI